MKTRFYHAILKPGLLGLTSISLAACASGRPNHGPPSGNDEFRGQSDRPTGFAIKPVALLFSEMDENDDRAVTTDELTSGLDAIWSELDIDPSNTISPINFSAWAATALGDANAAPNRIAFDVNLDGAITKTEFISRMKLEFSELDRNKDGTLTRSEFLFKLPNAGMGQRTQRGSGQFDGQRPPPRDGGRR